MVYFWSWIHDRGNEFSTSGVFYSENGHGNGWSWVVFHDHVHNFQVLCGAHLPKQSWQCELFQVVTWPLFLLRLHKISLHGGGVRLFSDSLPPRTICFGVASPCDFLNAHAHSLRGLALFTVDGEHRGLSGARHTCIQKQRNSLCVSACCST